METQLQWKTNRKSCMACRTSQLPLALSEAKGHFCCFKPF